jgi:hypothetical protein
MASRQEIFNAKLLDRSSNPKAVILTKENYDQLVASVLHVKTTGKKTPYDYWLSRKYDVVEVDGIRKLIVPMQDGSTSVRYYLHIDEMFHELEKVHSKIGHGGRDRMEREARQIFKNVSRLTVNDFIAGCEECERKKGKKRKGLVVKPIIHSHMNSRAQLDLIDMQSDPDGDFCFIFNYQDHLTKFVTLRALRTKTAEEVALHALDVFTTFGAPCILQTDNGREFKNKLMESLKGLWPDLTIVHGKPRHSQSQGSVERANQDVQNMLTTWKAENKTKTWSEGLRFVQYMKNRALHVGIKRSPFEAMFGMPARIGLERTGLPTDLCHLLANEEELEEALAGMYRPSDCSDDENEENDEENEQFNVDVLTERRETIMAQRAAAKEGLLHQAKRMKHDSDAKFPPPAIGATVRVPVPDVDRAKLDSRSILARVLRVTDDGLCELGTKSGRLEQLYARSQFSLCAEKFINEADVPGTTISLRSAARQQSLEAGGHGQGYVRCNCLKGCAANNCSCRRKGLLCNSKCHSSTSCSNK